MHDIKGSIQSVQALEGVSDELIQLELLGHVQLTELGHICAALVASKGSALPGAPSHQLEGSGGDLLAAGSHANDGAARRREKERGRERGREREGGREEAE